MLAGYSENKRVRESRGVVVVTSAGRIVGRGASSFIEPVSAGEYVSRTVGVGGNDIASL